VSIRTRSRPVDRCLLSRSPRPGARRPSQALAPLRGRGGYYLYPHNVLFDPFANALPPAASLRAGDYVVVYHRRGVQYNREARRLRFEGGDSVEAELIMVEPGAAVFRVG